MGARTARAVLALCALLALGAAAEPALPTVPVEIAGEPFRLEVAIDPRAQYRGLGGREHIDPAGGMLFVYGRPRMLQFVMRDCRVPIDIAYLDASGRVISIHHMTVEPPRRPDESAAEYEARLPRYPSGLPARYAVELAGGRMKELGLRGGDRIEINLTPLQQQR